MPTSSGFSINKKRLALSDPEFTERESKGFTLIELLVVISIIGILSAIGLVVYSNVLKQGRDSKRQSDLRSIQSALEMYRADKGEYPCGKVQGTCKGTSGNFGWDGHGGGWATNNDDGTVCWYTATLENVLETNGYMADMPHDPFGGCTGGRPYSGYMYEDHFSSDGDGGGYNVNGLNYCLYARLETLSRDADVGCDSCPAKTGDYAGFNYCVKSP